MRRRTFALLAGCLVSAAVAAYSYLVLLGAGLCEDGCASDSEKTIATVAMWVGVVGFVACLAVLLLCLPRATRYRAAWYPDPDDPEHKFRYWNGARWTEHRAPR
jgi:hypothetical protein